MGEFVGEGAAGVGFAHVVAEADGAGVGEPGAFGAVFVPGDGDAVAFGVSDELVCGGVGHGGVTLPLQVGEQVFCIL